MSQSYETIHSHVRVMIALIIFQLLSKCFNLLREVCVINDREFYNHPFRLKRSMRRKLYLIKSGEIHSFEVEHSNRRIS
jgi:DNA-binding LytR/AlgR family response regulator